MINCSFSCLDSHSDGTHSLQSIHSETLKQRHISPNLMKNKLFYYLLLLLFVVILVVLSVLYCYNKIGLYIRFLLSFRF